MKSELELKDFTVTPLSRLEILVQWEFKPMLESLSDYEIRLTRSESPHDEFSIADTLNASIGSVIVEHPIYRFWRNVFFRIEATHKTKDEVFISDPATVAYPPNIEALELKRRARVSLENVRYGNGIEVYLFLKKHGGERCVECYDCLKNRPAKSSCSNCYTTGFAGGFYRPIKTHINFSVDRKMITVVDMGEVSKSSHNALMGSYPIATPGDVIYDRRLHRAWLVETVENRERKRHLVKQLLNISEVEKTSVYIQMCEEKLKNE